MNLPNTHDHGAVDTDKRFVTSNPLTTTKNPIPLLFPLVYSSSLVSGQHCCIAGLEIDSGWSVLVRRKKRSDSLQEILRVQESHHLPDASRENSCSSQLWVVYKKSTEIHFWAIPKPSSNLNYSICILCPRYWTFVATPGILKIETYHKLQSH
jgi:hypothetical protein